MSRIIFIFILIFSRLGAQVGPPDLRCLEVVNSTGDVKLTWVPPTDPNNSFFGYQIYFSNNAGGPYFQVMSGIGPISTASAVHINTVATTQSGFYYMTSTYGAAGSSTSATSDTLRTIFLNVNTSLPDALKLTYNYLYPGQAAAGNVFTISREYPPGTWQDIATTPFQFYNDTLAICNTGSVQINYLVTLPGNGCSSRSNVQGGFYRDRHAPYEPYVDSVSVLPNGNTVIAWRIPKDLDISSYEIQQLKGGINQPIATINTRNATSYTLNTKDANNNKVGIYVKAIDSCLSGSLVDYIPISMFLETSYDFCRFQTTLRWNSYRWKKMNGRPLDEALIYRIYYSADSGKTYSRLDATKDTVYTHNGVKSNEHIFYFIRVVNKLQTMTASSNRSYFFSGQVDAPDFIYITTATIVKKNAASLHIHMDALKISRGMEVERSEDGINYTNIGFIPFTGSPDYSFLDEKIESSKKFYYYRCLIRDSCGNIRRQSNTCRTILLKIREDEENVFLKHLSWTPYEGFWSGVKNYTIYRMVNDINKFDRVGRVDSATFEFSDNLESDAPLGARIEYVVQAEEGYGNVYNIVEESLSNAEPVYVEGRIFVPNAFAPNGRNKTWKPITHFIDKREYGVTVFDRWGEVVFRAGTDSEAWDGGSYKSDVYIYLITYKNARGEYQEIKGNLMLIR